MHFIAFTCKEWKPNSLGRYGINSSASKTCFVTAMFGHMFIRLIIQNRFHLLLKNFSIWNSLSDVLSAPLFVATISIHLCCLRRWISSRRSSLQRIFRCQIFPCEDWQFGVLVFAVLFAWEMAWDSPIVNIVFQTMKRRLALHECSSLPCEKAPEEEAVVQRYSKVQVPAKYIKQHGLLEFIIGLAWTAWWTPSSTCLAGKWIIWGNSDYRAVINLIHKQDATERTLRHRGCGTD